MHLIYALFSKININLFYKIKLYDISKSLHFWKKKNSKFKMTTKPVIISSSGLKNIVLNKYQEADDFIFAFGEEKFGMKSIFAEFISPTVSYLHQTDPTINTINFNEINGINQDDFSKLSKKNDNVRHNVTPSSNIEWLID